MDDCVDDCVKAHHGRSGRVHDRGGEGDGYGHAGGPCGYGLNDHGPLHRENVRGSGYDHDVHGHLHHGNHHGNAHGSDHDHDEHGQRPTFRPS